MGYCKQRNTLTIIVYNDKITQRVTKNNSYVVLDGYSNEKEKEELMNWNLTAKTIKHGAGWKKFFEKIDFKGDFYWFKPL